MSSPSDPTPALQRMPACCCLFPSSEGCCGPSPHCSLCSKGFVAPEPSETLTQEGQVPGLTQAC